jgi:hypothetical protein
LTALAAPITLQSLALLWGDRPDRGWGSGRAFLLSLTISRPAFTFEKSSMLTNARTKAAPRSRQLLRAGVCERFATIRMPQLGSTLEQSLCVEPNKWGYDRG